MIIDSLLGILGITYIFVGLLLIVLSIPLISSKVGRNALYGVRIGKSFESDENWYAINKYGGKVLIVVGVITAVLGASYIFIGDVSNMLDAILSFLPIIVILIGCMVAYFHAKKL